MVGRLRTQDSRDHGGAPGRIQPHRSDHLNRGRSTSDDGAMWRGCWRGADDGSYMALPSQSAHATDATPTAVLPQPRWRVDRLWPRSGQDASLSSDADHAGERPGPGCRRDLPYRGTLPPTMEHPRRERGIRSHAIDGRRCALPRDGHDRVVALDAGTGAEPWVFDPKIYLTREYAEVASRASPPWVDPEKDSTEVGYR